MFEMGEVHGRIDGEKRLYDNFSAHVGMWEVSIWNLLRVGITRCTDRQAWYETLVELCARMNHLP